MIIELPVIELLALETFASGVWTPWTGALQTVSVDRGGNRSGAFTTVNVGTLSATLVNAGDPLTDGSLKPNLPIRLVSVAQAEGAVSVPVFTGRVVDVVSTYRLNKSTNVLTTYVSLSAVDAVAAHANITRYGAVTDGALGFETWAARIIRLSASAVTTVTTPADDSPIVRYSI